MIVSLDCLIAKTRQFWYMFSDKQSITALVLDKTCESLGVDGLAVDFLLSLMANMWPHLERIGDRLE